MRTRRNYSNKERNFVSLTVRIPESLELWIKQFCLENRMSVSYFITQLLERVKESGNYISE